MNSMKRVGLVAFLVALTAFFAVSPVLADKDPQNVILLVPPEDSPEPDAYGIAIDKGTRGGIAIVTYVTVKCENLTPGQEYVVCSSSSFGVTPHSVTADRKGNLSLTFRELPLFVLWVENAAGDVVLEEF